MNSIDFLKEKLGVLHNSCSYLEIKYEYRNYINTHIIEVKPIHCFEKDKQYALGQISLEDKFEELFPDEEILFVSENKLISVSNPILELGVSFGDCIIEVVNPPLKSNYSIDSMISYEIRTNLNDDYNIPIPRKKSWIKNLINKKDFEPTSKSFFLYNFVI